MNASVLQPLMDLLKVANPTDLTNEEIIRFRAWLQAAYQDAGKETAETVEELPKVQPAVKIINTQPTSAHLDRVMTSLLAWECQARKRMARRGYRAPRVARFG